MVLPQVPVYEFRCLTCHEPFELDRPREKCSDLAGCPACGSHKTVRSWSITVPRIRNGDGDGRPTERKKPKPTAVGPYNATLENCTLEGGGTGIKLGPGVRVKSRGLRLRNNRVGIDNDGGHFDGPDTKFE